MRRPEAIVLAAALALLPAAARGRDASVVLRWKPVADAVQYELEIGADPELRRVLVRERVPTAGYRWRELPDERRWWRVRGVDAGGRPGRWSEVKPLEPVLRPPEARAPPDGVVVAAGGEVELACAPSPLADAYELEIARDAAFADVVERRQGREPRFRLALGAGAYRWRMRGSVDGQTTRWSSPRRLSVAEAAAAARPAAPEPPTAATDGTAEAAEIPAASTAPASVAKPREGVADDVAPAPAAPPAPPPTPEPPPAVAVVPDAALAGPNRGRVRAGARLGWHTTFGGISTLSSGVEADWRLPGKERLSLSARLGYYGVSSTVPPMAGLAAPLRVSARVVPIGGALVWARPVASFALYAGAGGQAQLVHTAMAGQERLDLVPGVLLLAGAGRRLGRGELFLEAGWASGTLDGELARLQTGGFQLAAGIRGAP
jgi:hypothetical protein